MRWNHTWLAIFLAGCGSSSTGTTQDASASDAGSNDGGAGDAGTTNIGAPCNTSGADPACGTSVNATCNDQTADGFPGGYCSVEPCSTSELCPAGSICAHLGGESDACWKACTSDADCRAPDYACTNVDPLVTSGSGHKVCFLKQFACTKSSECPAVMPTCGGTDAGGGTMFCH